MEMPLPKVNMLPKFSRSFEAILINFNKFCLRNFTKMDTILTSTARRLLLEYLVAMDTTAC